MQKKPSKKSLQKKISALDKKIDIIDDKLGSQNELEQLTKRIDELNSKRKSSFWIPTLISLLAIAVSVFSIYNDNRIADKSGEFDKGDLDFMIGAFKLNKDKKSVVVLVNEVENIDVLLMGIPFTIYNAGEAKVDNCNITISYPKANGKIAVNTEEYFVPNNSPINLTRSFFKEEFVDLIRYDIPKIQPSEPITFNELMVFRNSSISDNLETKDKDSVPILVGYRVEIAYESNISIKSDQLSSTNYEISYHHFNLNRWNEIKTSDFILEYIKNENIDLYLVQDAVSETEVIDQIGKLTMSNFVGHKVRKSM